MYRQIGFQTIPFSQMPQIVGAAVDIGRGHGYNAHGMVFGMSKSIAAKQLLPILLVAVMWD